MKISTVLAFSHLLLMACSAHAEGFDWVKPSLPQVPPARLGANMAFDPVNLTTVMFGGETEFGATLFNDTWNFSARKGWVQVFPANSPAPGDGSRMTYDVSTKTIVLFGSNSGDTWIWDGANWTMYHPALSPQARNTQGMAYEPGAKKVLMFGGQTSAGEILNDTWEWDGTTKTWRQRLPASSPSPRRTNLVYDDAVGALVLYGGDSASGDCCDTYYTDTWTWDGKTWTQHFPASSPPARALPALAYDAAIGKLVMFGGYIVPGEGLSDTWMWNGITWSQSQTTFSPPGSWAAGVAYDSVLKSIVLFGGEITGDPVANDTWLGIK